MNFAFLFKMIFSSKFAKSEGFNEFDTVTNFRKSWCLQLALKSHEITSHQAVLRTFPATQGCLAAWLILGQSMSLPFHNYDHQIYLSDLQVFFS